MGCCGSVPAPVAPAPNPLAGLGRIRRRLKELDLELPEASAPVANYAMWSSAPVGGSSKSELIFLAGHIDKDGAKGKLTADSELENIDAAKASARQIVLNMFATLNNTLDGDIDRVERFVKLSVYVSCESSFEKHPVVADAASDLLAQILDEDGRSARAAVGKANLPLDVTVEIDAVVQVQKK